MSRLRRGPAQWEVPFGDPGDGKAGSSPLDGGLTFSANIGGRFGMPPCPVSGPGPGHLHSPLQAGITVTPFYRGGSGGSGMEEMRSGTNSS